MRQHASVQGYATAEALGDMGFGLPAELFESAIADLGRLAQREGGVA